VHGGFVEVSGDSVIILSDVAEAADQIDTERARRARDRVESELRSDPDSDELKAALQRADVRLEVAAK
jgi:F-type H+-transporting ATPase subunit epsilon